MNKSIICSLGFLTAACLVGGSIAINQPVKAGALAETKTSAAFMLMGNTTIPNYLTSPYQSDVSVPLGGTATQTWTFSRARYSASKGYATLGDTDDTETSISKRVDTNDIFYKIAQATGQAQNEAAKMQAMVSDYAIEGINDIHFYWTSAEAGFVQVLASADDGATWNIVKNDDGENSTWAAPATPSGEAGAYNHYAYHLTSWRLAELAVSPLRIAFAHFMFGGVGAAYLNLGGVVINSLNSAKAFVENNGCGDLVASDEKKAELAMIDSKLTADNIAALKATVIEPGVTYLDRYNMYLKAAGQSERNSVVSIFSEENSSTIAIAISVFVTALLGAVAVVVLKKKRHTVR